MSMAAALTWRKVRKLSSPPYPRAYSAPASETASASSTKPPISSTLPRLACARGTSVGSPSGRCDGERSTKQVDPASDVSECGPVDAEHVLGGRLDPKVADGARTLDRPLRERDGGAGPSRHHQVPGQPGEDPGLTRRRRHPLEQVDRLLQQPDRGGGVTRQPGREPVSLTGPGATLAVTVGPCRRVDVGQRPAGQVDGLGRITDQRGRGTRAVEQVPEVAVGRSGGSATRRPTARSPARTGAPPRA